MRAQSLLLLIGTVLYLGSSLSAQSDQYTLFGVFEMALSLNQPTLTADYPDHRGDPGPSLAFNGLFAWRVTPRLQLEAGLGGSLHFLNQFKDAPGRFADERLVFDMRTEAIFGHIPAGVRYYFRPDNRGLYLRTGATVLFEIAESTQFCERDCEGGSGYQGYLIRGAFRNALNPMLQAGLGYQIQSKRGDFFYFELFVQRSAGTLQRSGPTGGEQNWANHAGDVRLQTIGLRVGSPIFKPGKPSKAESQEAR